jgi:phosphorylcholine metabolism protein LicD
MNGIVKDLKTINTIFKKHNVSLWLNWGTLLGAVRDKKLIDNDIDLGTINLNVFITECHMVIKELKNLGFKVEEYDLGMVITKNKFRAGIGYYDVDRDSKTLMQKGLPVNYLNKFFAKKFYYAFMRKNPTNFKYQFFKCLGGKYIIHIIPISLVCPLRRFEFYGDTFYIPNMKTEYLKYLYGPKWYEPDPTFPHFISNNNIDYFKDTFHKFYAKCPNCGEAFVCNRLNFKKPIEKQLVHCPACRNEWKQKVFIKGTIMRKI